MDGVGRRASLPDSHARTRHSHFGNVRFVLLVEAARLRRTSAAARASPEHLRAFQLRTWARLRVSSSLVVSWKWF